MNLYQKIGVFLARLSGLAIIAMVILSFVYLGVSAGASLPTHGMTWEETYWTSGVWLAVGASLLFLAKPIGAFLGRGLD